MSSLRPFASRDGTGEERTHLICVSQSPRLTLAITLLDLFLPFSLPDFAFTHSSLCWYHSTVEPSPLASSTAASASPTIATPSEPGTKPPTSRATAPTTTANGTATTQDGSTTSRPPAPPLEDQEMLAFGTVAEQEILPPPPRDPNAPLVGQDIPGDAANAAATGTKRSMGTGAAAAGPLARAKRPKNVKFRSVPSLSSYSFSLQF